MISFSSLFISSNHHHYSLEAGVSPAQLVPSVGLTILVFIRRVRRGAITQSAPVQSQPASQTSPGAEIHLYGLNMMSYQEALPRRLYQL